jgi:four helix bundle protein
VEDRLNSSKEKEMGIQSYRELEVWQLGMDLAEECYRVTKGFPKEERFGMTGPIRRAAASIPANIAEGQGREHTREFLHHLSVARGSLMELETHLTLSQRVGLLDQDKTTPLLTQTERISRMLSGLRISRMLSGLQPRPAARQGCGVDPGRHPVFRAYRK